MGASVAGALVIVGVLGCMISHEVRSATCYRSTARKALLWLVVSVGMVVGGLYYATILQIG